MNPSLPSTHTWNPLLLSSINYGRMALSLKPVEHQLLRFIMLLFSVLDVMCQLQGKFVDLLDMHLVKGVPSAQKLFLVQ